MRAFIEDMAAKGRLAYVNAVWQTIFYDGDIDEVELPQGPDLSTGVASQAAHMRDHSQAAASKERCG